MAAALITQGVHVPNMSGSCASTPCTSIVTPPRLGLSGFETHVLHSFTPMMEPHVAMNVTFRSIFTLVARNVP